MIYKLEQQAEGDNARFIIDMTGYELHTLREVPEFRNSFFKCIENELKIERNNQADIIEAKLDKLIAYIIPEVKDNSKHLAEAKELANKGKPPRKQPKKKEEICDLHKTPISKCGCAGS